ncbi:MAG: ABC transporter ATP-binding protein [Mycobacteriales bacterium]
MTASALPQVTKPLISARGITAAYVPDRGTQVVAVDDVSIDVHEGEIVGVAGESGCGKSTLGAVLSLNAVAPLHVLGGELEVDGAAVDLSNRKTPRSWRGRVVSLLPQGALNSLSPTIRIRDFACDVVRAHDSKVKRSAALEMTRARLEQLDLPGRVLDAYPHQLSGGMKQRVVTVLSTLLEPRLLIADEPTSALDVSSQRVLVDMLREMVHREIISGVIFVTHDIPVLNTIADRIAIMYAGKIVEIAETRELIDRPRHPYSAALLGSVLVPEPHVRRSRVLGIPGAPPNLVNPPTGCRFRPRCPLRMPECENDPPHAGDSFHFASCFWAEQHEGESAVPALRAATEKMSAEEAIAIDAATSAAAVGDAGTIEVER